MRILICAAGCAAAMVLLSDVGRACDQCNNSHSKAPPPAADGSAPPSKNGSKDGPPPPVDNPPPQGDNPSGGTASGGDSGPSAGGDAPTPDSSGGTSAGSPSSGGGSSGGPSTGGSNPPPSTGGAGGGPQTGGGGDAHGPRTAGKGSGIDAGRWTYWWYAKRAFLLDSVRVQAHLSGTPSTTPSGDTQWRSDARAALAAALTDPDERVVGAAALAIGKAGDAADAPLVQAVALDANRNLEVRQSAAMALGLLHAARPEEGAAPRKALQSLASDEKLPPNLRAITVYALGLRREPDSVPFLLDCASRASHTWDVPAAGATALGLSGCSTAREDLEKMLRPSAKKDGAKFRRVYAAHGLARLDEPRALPALLVALKDDEKDVRQAAALAVGAVSPASEKDAVEALVKVLQEDRDPGARAAAAVSLGVVGGDEALAALRRCYDRDDPSVRCFAAVATGMLARKANRPQLVANLVHDLKRGTRHELLGATCVAVGLAGATDAMPMLRKIVVDGGDPEVAALAVVALALVGDRAEGPSILRKVLYTANDPMLRSEAAIGLGLLGDTEVLIDLDRMAREGTPDAERITGCLALGRIGGAGAAKPLVAILSDRKGSPLLRHVAATALGLLLDDSEGRRIGSVAADLNWRALTPTVCEILEDMGE
jgi:HEAT repeat protein